MHRVALLIIGSVLAAGCWLSPAPQPPTECTGLGQPDCIGAVAAAMPALRDLACWPASCGTIVAATVERLTCERAAHVCVEGEPDLIAMVVLTDANGAELPILVVRDRPGQPMRAQALG